MQHHALLSAGVRVHLACLFLQVGRLIMHSLFAYGCKSGYVVRLCGG